MPTEKKGSNFKQDRDRKGPGKKVSAVGKAAGKAVGKMGSKVKPKKKELSNMESIGKGFKDNFLFGAFKKDGGSVSDMPTKKAFEIGGAVRDEGSMVEGMNRDKKRTVVTDPEGNKVINKKRRDGSTKSTVKFKKENRGSVGGKRRQVDIYK
jgi:hypothetical protein